MNASSSNGISIFPIYLLFLHIEWLKIVLLMQLILQVNNLPMVVLVNELSNIMVTTNDSLTTPYINLIQSFVFIIFTA